MGYEAWIIQISIYSENIRFDQLFRISCDGPLKNAFWPNLLPRGTGHSEQQVRGPPGPREESRSGDSTPSLPLKRVQALICVCVCRSVVPAKF